MGVLTADISMSLDGFIAGPNDSPENPLGDGGERLHEWMFCALASHLAADEMHDTTEKPR